MRRAVTQLSRSLTPRVGRLRDAALPILAPIWRALPEWLQWRVMWLATAKFTVGVTGIVFDETGNVLLLKHTFRRRYPWGLLSGWVQRGETLVDALHREVHEETKLNVAIDRLLMVRTDRFGLFLEVVYLCRAQGGVFQPSNEVTEARWCRPDDLPDGVHPHHGPLIRQALAMRQRPATSMQEREEANR